MNRRRLLQAAAVGTTVFSIVPRHVLGGQKFVAPSDKVNIALIGAGGQGRTNLRELFKQNDAQVIAVADPATSFSLDRFYYKGMGGREPIRAEIEKRYQSENAKFKCTVYEDFREMLDKEKGIDAILCATPDHLHAYVSIHAMRAGKHVYCEKPLTHNIWEARTVAKVAQETGVATQMGNQGHSTEGMRQTVELIQSSAIGTVREVHAWVNGNRWNPLLQDRPTDSMAKPDGLNWDLWLGPRAERPFHSAYFPVAWRDFWNFGGSNIGDFGCHDLDAACWALDLHAPATIDFSPAGPTNSEIAPYGCVGYYDFPARGDRPAVKVTWYDGGLKPPRPNSWPSGESLPNRGVLFVGDKGELFCGGAGGAPKLLPESRARELPPPAATLARSNGHHRDWLDACKGGPPASSNFAYGARLTEIALLGVLALRTQKRIEWNAEKMQATGVAQADAIIKENYRDGWRIEGT